MHTFLGHAKFEAFLEATGGARCADTGLDETLAVIPLAPVGRLLAQTAPEKYLKSKCILVLLQILNNIVFFALLSCFKIITKK